MLELSTLVSLIKKHHADIQSVSANARHALPHRGTNTLFVGLPSVDMRSILKNQIDALINEGHTWDEILYIDFEDAAFLDFETADLQRLLRAYAALHPNHTPIVSFLTRLASLVGQRLFAESQIGTSRFIWLPVTTSHRILTLSRRWAGVYSFNPFGHWVFVSGVKVKGATKDWATTATLLMSA